jgi:Tfp pilus assembly protein PilO
MKFIYAGIAVILAGAAFFLYTKPTYDAMQANQTLVSQYDVALNKVAELDKVRDKLLQQNNSFDPANLDRLQKFVPDHVDNIALILDIDGIASRYGMALQNIDVGGSGNAATTDTAIHSSGSAYNSIIMKFSVQGSYDTLLAFMGDLQSSLRLVDIESFSLSPGNTQTPGSNARIYTLSLTLRTYWIK